MRKITINIPTGKTNAWEPWGLTKKRAFEIRDQVLKVVDSLQENKVPYNIYNIMNESLPIAKTTKEQLMIVFMMGFINNDN